MTTVQLRWLEKQTGKNAIGETTKTLQYRYQEKVTDYSRYNPTTGDYHTNTVWSGWLDVPTQLEGVKL